MDGVIIMKNTFSWPNFERSFHIWYQIKAVLNILTFSKWPPFRGCITHYININDTGSLLYQPDSHEHFQKFLFLIDALLQISSMLRWEKMTYFLTR